MIMGGPYLVAMHTAGASVCNDNSATNQLAMQTPHQYDRIE